jgi:predicted transcriptional regulator
MLYLSRLEDGRRVSLNNQRNKFQTKKMRKVTYPQEIELWYVLPAIRKQIALAFIKKGMSQKQVAKIMGITEATISHYKKDKRASTKILEIPDLRQQIEFTITKITNNKSSLTAEILRLNKLVKDSGLLCELYASNTTLKEAERPCNTCSHNKELDQDQSKPQICFTQS